MAFDHFGAGPSNQASSDLERYADLHGYARDVVEIGEALELRNATFIGHSVSAMIGVLSSIESPELFDRLVLLAPSPRYLNDPPYLGGFELDDVNELLGFMEQNFRGWATSFADLAAREPAAASELVRSFQETERDAILQFAKATFFCDHRADLANVKPACLVVQCSDDDIAPLQVGEYTAERLPRAVYRVLEASGHLPHLTHADETTRLIEEFLAQPID